MYGNLIYVKGTNLRKSQSRGIRRKALQKIAELSATSPSKNDTHADLDRLYRLVPEHIINNNNGYNGEEQHAPPMVSLSRRRKARHNVLGNPANHNPHFRISDNLKSFFHFAKPLLLSKTTKELRNSPPSWHHILLRHIIRPSSHPLSSARSSHLQSRHSVTI